MKTVQITLYSYHAEGLTLKQAIDACQQQLVGAIALLYSPNACQFLRLINDDFQDSYGRTVSDLSDFFEARIFTENFELRWLNRNSGIGDAVLLSESGQSIDHFTRLESKTCEALEQKYLLWGEKVKNQPNQTGWRRLAEARIGKLDIPLDQDINDRVYLKTREYLTTVDDYGNFAVIEERLLKLEAK